MKNIHKILLLLAVLGLLVSLSSCLMLSGTIAMSTISVDNKSDDETIYFLYISPADSKNWGSGVMGDDVIKPDDTFDLNVPPGSYDIQITNMFDVELGSIYDQLVLPGESMTLTFTKDNLFIRSH